MPMCFKSLNCTGDIISSESHGYFSKRECCVGTDDGNSFLTGGKCIVPECMGNIQTKYNVPVQITYFARYNSCMCSIIFPMFQFMDLNMHTIL